MAKAKAQHPFDRDPHCYTSGGIPAAGLFRSGRLMAPCPAHDHRRGITRRSQYITQKS
jgi:hypothetical protein